MVEHAVAALHHGLCDVAVISHGESGRSGVGVTRARDTALSGQYEIPYGFGAAPTWFSLITTRHMHEHGTTLEQWAQVAVSTRAWACLNPKAMHRKPITVADVLSSRPVVWPFNLLNICLVTDGGGAVVLTRPDRARDCAKKPVWVRGMGEATEHVSLTQMKKLTFSESTRLSGQRAFAMAGVTAEGLRPHHAVRRVHLGASHHARVTGRRQAGGGCALLRKWPLDAGGLAAHQHQRGRALLHPHRDVRDLPHHRGRAPAARRSRCPSGPRREALPRERNGRHAVGGGHRSCSPTTASRWARRLGDTRIERYLDGKDVVLLGTVSPSGAPLVTPMWFLHDAQALTMISVDGLPKVRNLRRDPAGLRGGRERHPRRHPERHRAGPGGVSRRHARATGARRALSRQVPAGPRTSLGRPPPCRPTA